MAKTAHHIDELVARATTTIAELQQAVRDARDLARFEAGDDFADSTDAGELQALRDAAAARAQAEQDVADAVGDARARGLPWSVIGAAIGTTGQAANQRYGKAAG